MCPKVTKNGTNLQIILPKTVCMSVRIEPGEVLDITTDGDTISMVRPVAPLSIKAQTIFTIGYESRDIEKFIARLKMHGVRQIIDVREKPISRKKGFSKTALQKKLKDEGIEYIHMQKLGSPSEIRHEYKEGGSETLFFERYRSYLETIPEELDVLDGFTSNMPSALMCFELSHIHCHRKIIAEKLKTFGYEVVPL
jgi:uncharacterized protein (DUF488 family)